MKINEFPGCCTASVMYDLGGSSAAMHRDSEVPTEKLKEEYDNAIKAHNIYEDGDDCDSREGNAVMVACTTTEQDTANEFLKSKGFLCAGPYKKPKHPETGLYLWWLPLFGMYGTEG